jgi:hypothetical protein
MRKLLMCVLGLIWLVLPISASAYLMQMQTYKIMFERADVAVIATPISTLDSKAQLKVDQPKPVLDQIKTVDTEFKVAYVLKGKLESATFHFLHLNLKDGQPGAMAFGMVGTFFVDFESKENKSKSFILFMTKQKDGTYCPAWEPMEGSRAMIAIQKDGEL